MTRFEVVQGISQKLDWMQDRGMDDTQDFIDLKKQGKMLYDILTPEEQAQFKQWAGPERHYSEYLLEPYSRWYHPDSKSHYIAVGIGRCSTNGLEDQNIRYAIYWSCDKKEYKVRDLAEFLDGRFVPLGADGLPLPVYDDGSGILWKLESTQPPDKVNPSSQKKPHGEAVIPQKPLVCHFNPPVDVGPPEDNPPEECV